MVAHHVHNFVVGVSKPYLSYSYLWTAFSLLNVMRPLNFCIAAYACVHVMHVYKVYMHIPC